MITCEEIYGLHTSKTPESAIHAAYRDIPLDSRNGMRKNATPLHMACTFADEEAVRILLERGADVNVKNDDGDTPLCVLAKHNYCRQEAAFAEIAGLLLSKGARILRSGKNTTALIEAVRNRHFLMADALLMSGNRIDSADSNGDNVLHAICQSAGDIAYDIKRTEERIADFSVPQTLLCGLRRLSPPRSCGKKGGHDHAKEIQHTPPQPRCENPAVRR